MTVSNRTTTFPTIWAKDAPDVSPNIAPVRLTTYAQTDLSNADLEAGWPYSKINDSSMFNEVMRRVTTLLQSIEQYGTLPWCSTTQYKAGGKCIASNGLEYRAKVDSLNEDPTNSLVTSWTLIRSIGCYFGVRVTATTVLTSHEFEQAIYCQPSGNITVTLPPLTANDGGCGIAIYNIGPGTVTVAMPSGINLYARGIVGGSSMALAAGEGITLFNDTASWIQLGSG
jgi:hypothetical protein